MKYSLRSLMIVVAVLPPLLAVGWRVLDSLRPKRVYPGSHDSTRVDWQAAVKEVEAIEAMRKSRAPAPNPPNP